MLNSLFCFIVASVPAGAESANVLEQVVGKFGVDWRLLIAQIINFVVVTYLLYRFAFKPVLKTLSDRQKRIADGLQYTEEVEQKLKETEKEKNQIIKKASQDAKEIIDAAKEQAKNYLEKQSQEALLKAEETMKKAEAAIVLEKKQMLLDARKEIKDLVISTSEKVLSTSLTDQDRARFGQLAVKELSMN